MNNRSIEVRIGTKSPFESLTFPFNLLFVFLFDFAVVGSSLLSIYFTISSVCCYRRIRVSMDEYVPHVIVMPSNSTK